MSNTDPALTQLIERIERMEEDKAAVSDDIKAVYAEAKSTGYDPKIMKTVIKLRAMERAARLEQEALIETYKAAVGLEN